MTQLLSANMVKRIKQSLAETEEWMIKELALSADLRPPATQQLLNGYIAHRDKLKRMLEENRWIP